MNETPETYFQQLYEPIYFPIKVIDENGKIVYINQAFNLQWEYSLQELKEYSVLLIS